jgi:hypothetical protein
MQPKFPGRENCCGRLEEVAIWRISRISKYLAIVNSQQRWGWGWERKTGLE